VTVATGYGYAARPGLKGYLISFKVQFAIPAKAGMRAKPDLGTKDGKIQNMTSLRER
jgi:hypothetical protein